MKSQIYSKYKSKFTKSDYEKDLVNNLLETKNCRLVVQLKESMIYDYIDEFLKRYYKTKESRDRIPKFVNYYKNYLKFFCKPTFRNFKLNDIIQSHGEKCAEVYYQKNYGNEERKEKKLLEKKNKKLSELKTIFTDTIKESINNITIEYDQSDISINSINTLQLNKSNIFNNSKNYDNLFDDIKYDTYENRISLLDFISELNGNISIKNKVRINQGKALQNGIKIQHNKAKSQKNKQMNFSTTANTLNNNSNNIICANSTNYNYGTNKHIQLIAKPIVLSNRDDFKNNFINDADLGNAEDCYKENNDNVDLENMNNYATTNYNHIPLNSIYNNNCNLNMGNNRHVNQTRTFIKKNKNQLNLNFNGGNNLNNLNLGNNNGNHNSKLKLASTPLHIKNSLSITPFNNQILGVNKGENNYNYINTNPNNNVNYNLNNMYTYDNTENDSQSISNNQFHFNNKLKLRGSVSIEDNKKITNENNTSKSKGMNNYLISVNSNSKSIKNNKNINNIKEINHINHMKSSKFKQQSTSNNNNKSISKASIDNNNTHTNIPSISTPNQNQNQNQNQNNSNIKHLSDKTSSPSFNSINKITKSSKIKYSRNINTNLLYGESNKNYYTTTNTCNTNPQNNFYSSYNNFEKQQQLLNQNKKINTKLNINTVSLTTNPNTFRTTMSHLRTNSNMISGGVLNLKSNRLQINKLNTEGNNDDGKVSLTTNRKLKLTKPKIKATKIKH